MRALLTMASLLSLTGCYYAPSTSNTTTTINGSDVLHSVVTEPEPGKTRFACAESATGNCKYAVFTRDCQTASDHTGTTTCTTRVIDQFTLAKGESRDFRDLPSGFHHCVSRERMPAAEQCVNQPGG